MKLILPAPRAARCLLSSVRFSSSVRTAMVRMEVAVGTPRLASMFSTMRSAPPRMGWAMSPGMSETGARAFERAGAAGGAAAWTRITVVPGWAVASGTAARTGCGSLTSWASGPSSSSGSGMPVARSK